MSILTTAPARMVAVNVAVTGELSVEATAKGSSINSGLRRKESPIPLVSTLNPLVIIEALWVAMVALMDAVTGAS